MGRARGSRAGTDTPSGRAAANRASTSPLPLAPRRTAGNDMKMSIVDSEIEKKIDFGYFITEYFTNLMIYN